MAITTMDGLVSALGGAQRLLVNKASVTSVAGIPFSIWSAAGQPGVGSTTLGQAAAGAVSTSSDTGTLGFTNPGSGNSYLAGARGSCAATGLIVIFDMLWVWGSGGSGWSATTTGAQNTSSPAALTRPDANGTNTELWFEHLSAIGSAQSVTVSYTNSVAASGHSAAATPGGTTIGRMTNLPLAAGDNGVKTVQSLTLGASMTSGTARLTIMRRIAEIPCTANIGFAYDAFDLGMPRVYDSASLMIAFFPNSTATGPMVMSVALAQG